MPSADRERLKFLDFEFETLPDGRCRARVVLEGHGERYEGAADGMGSQAGELRCAAQATARALQALVEDQVTFELLGVKAVRAFDATVIIVSLSSLQESTATRLVGSCLSESDLTRGAALAVLNATNRMLGNMFFMR